MNASPPPDQTVRLGHPKRNASRHPLVGLLILAALAGCGSYPAGEAAMEALISDDRVEVTLDPWLVFTPTSAAPSRGLVFYPGGAVKPESYAPLARKFAEVGWLSVIPPMPFDLAILGVDAASEVFAAHPEIARWTLAGHSLGVVAAAEFAHGHPEEVEALALFASYPQQAHDLSERDIAVLSMVGTEDEVVNRDRLTEAEAWLPASTTYIELDGGNHAQFGDYGPQSGDGIAGISPEAQWEAAFRATLALWPDDAP